MNHYSDIFDLEKILYIESRKSDLTPLMKLSPLPFQKCKGLKRKKKTFISALLIPVIKNT